MISEVETILPVLLWCSGESNGRQVCSGGRSGGCYTAKSISTTSVCSKSNIIEDSRLGTIGRGRTRAVGKSGANKEKSQNGTVTTAGQVLFGLARPVHHLDWRGALKRLHFSLLLLTSLCTRSLENRRSHQQSPRTLGACNKG